MFSASYVSRINKKSTRWVWLTTQRGEKKYAYKSFSWGNLKESDHFEDLGTAEMVILNWILGK